MMSSEMTAVTAMKTWRGSTGDLGCADFHLDVVLVIFRVGFGPEPVSLDDAMRRGFGDSFGVGGHANLRTTRPWRGA